MKLNEIRDGSTGNAIFWVKSKVSSRARNGSTYLSLSVADTTLELKAKIWNADELTTQLCSGDFIQASFQAQIYNDSLQLVLSDVLPASPSEYSPTDFFKKAKYDTDVMYNKLLEYATSIKDDDVRRLVLSFYEDELFSKEMRTMPAAKSIHHSFIGGLLQHTLFVTRNAATLSKLYSVDYDLCVAAAMLHDIGKLKELTNVPAVEFTLEGVALGHLSMSCFALDRRMHDLGIDGEKSIKLLHCVLAHHGQKDWGSPVVPACPEAVVVHVSDLLDARIEAMIEEIESSTRDSSTTEFNRFLSTSLIK